MITREEWLNKLTENMISWAEDKLGNKEYAGWCLSFIEDALEKSNVIEIFGGNSAKESALLYADGMRQDIPERGAFVFYDCICQGPDGPVNWGHCGISLGDGRIIHVWDVVRIDDYRDIDAMTALSGDHPKYIGWVPLGRVLKQKEDVYMNEYIAYCGLDCEACEARIATVNNDAELRQRVAKEWSELNGVEITAEMINCSGCRIPGVKTPYCDSLCPIRQCAMGKQMETCGSCPEMNSCEKLAMVTGNNADALQRLKEEEFVQS